MAPNGRPVTSRTIQLASAVEIFDLPLTSLAIASIATWLLRTAKMHQIDKAPKTRKVTMRLQLAQLLRVRLALLLLRRKQPKSVESSTKT